MVLSEKITMSTTVRVKRPRVDIQVSSCMCVGNPPRVRRIQSLLTYDFPFVVNRTVPRIRF